MGQPQLRPALQRTALLVALACSAAGRAGAQEILKDVNEPEDEGVSRFHIPYALYSATYEFAVGYVYTTTGLLQDQLGLFATALVSTNGSIAAILGFNDAQLPNHPRITFDGYLSLGHYSNLRAYIDGNPDFPNSPSGTNDSSPDNFIEESANELWFELPVRYLFPIGVAKDQAIHTFYLDRGLLAEGSTRTGLWNPLESGRTYLGVQPFYRRQEFDSAAESGALSTNGLEFSLEYDNTDFNRNPTRGSRQALTLARDFGGLDSTDPWTNLSFDFSAAFPLAPGRRTRQRVLTFDFWTSDSLSWEDSETPTGVETTGAPPYFAGATLGGLNRLRAYPTDRFHDQAAIYYALEYRVTPNWQPMARRRERLMKPLEIDFWQWVLFAEAGRVAPAWSLSTLHEDLKWDVGISLRFMAHKQIVRFDLAAGPEGVALLVDFKQPF